MPGTPERRCEPGAGVAQGGIDLGLRDEQAPRQIGTAQVRAPEVRACQVGHTEIRTPQIGSNERCAAQALRPQVRVAEVGADKVRPPAVERCTSGGTPGELARLEEQSVHRRPVGLDVERREGVGIGPGESFGLVDGGAEGGLKAPGRLQGRRLGQVPEQLMELAHDRERSEHPGRCSRGALPVRPAEGDLGDFLSRAEAVVCGAPGEPTRTEAVVNDAAEGRVEVRARRSGVLVDGEVGGDREGRSDTAEAEAPGAVGEQVEAPALGGGVIALGGTVSALSGTVSAFGEGVTPLGGGVPALGGCVASFGSLGQRRSPRRTPAVTRFASSS